MFCVHAEKDKVKANVPDVATWDFYVVATATLNREFGAAKSLSLAAGCRMAVRCKWEGLRAAVDSVLTATAKEQQATTAGVGVVNK